MVALRLDRLFRSIGDCVGTVQGWDKAGVALHLISLGGQAVDTGSVMGRAMLALMAAFGEMESESKKERAVDAWDYQRARGQRLGSVAPYGFNMVDGRAVPDQDEQAAISRILMLRAEGLSVARIRDALQQTEFKPRGERWNSTHHHRPGARARVRVPPVTKPTLINTRGLHCTLGPWYRGGHEERPADFPKATWRPARPSRSPGARRDRRSLLPLRAQDGVGFHPAPGD